MWRVLGFLALAFKAWMLYDAYKRKAEQYWLWIIVAVPGGALIYFFMVRIKAHDAKVLQKKVVRSLKGPTSVQELEYRYTESPSIANRVALGQGLYDAQRFDQAFEHFEAVLQSRPDEPDALYGAGASALALGRAALAVERLRRLIEVNPTYREFIGYQQLAEALDADGKLDEAVELLRKLAKSHPRIPHVVVLSDYLLKAGLRTEALGRLSEALRSHESSPPHTRKLYRQWADRARRIVAQAPEA
jgi:hypothetical protein